jgi:uncharacterized small protein (DUF1192 family)
MFEDDDDRPARRAPQERKLDGLSVEELESYIARLEAEIARACAAIEARRSVRGAAEALFKPR